MLQIGVLPSFTVVGLPDKAVLLSANPHRFDLESGLFYFWTQFAMLTLL